MAIITTPKQAKEQAKQTSGKSLRWKITLSYFCLPLVVFAVTSLPGLSRLTPWLALVIIAALLVQRFTKRLARHSRIALWTLLVLTLVGSSGWFFSPFFFTLYLMAVGLGFLYTPVVAIAFTLALITLFSFSVGEVSPTYDFLTLLSLLTVIPIVVALRRSFLLVQQEQKGILILEEAKPETGITSLDAILKNRINRWGILLRQPTTYLKQGLALLSEQKLKGQDFTEVLDRMQRAVDELTTLVKEFESGTTRNLLLGRRRPSESKKK